MKYEDYLKSDDWKKLRLRVLKRANYKCEFCGSVAREIHHVMYLKKENSEMDNVNHLVACCKRCHKLCHGIRYNTPLIKNLAKKQGDTINECLKQHIHKDILNVLVRDYEFLEFTKNKKIKVIKELKSKPYREMLKILEK